MKVNWSEFINVYLPTITTWLLGSSLLALPKYSYVSAFIQSILILLWSYKGHVYAHDVSCQWPFNILNTHVYIHHKKEVSIPKWFELLIEAFFNFLGFMIIVIFQEISGIKLFSTSLVLGAAFLYVTIHVLDFSIFGNDIHKKHHEQTFCNYDPSFLDVLFDTRCDPDEPYTVSGYEIPQALFAFSLAYIIKKKWKLD